VTTRRPVGRHRAVALGLVGLALAGCTPLGPTAGEVAAPGAAWTSVSRAGAAAAAGVAVARDGRLYVTDIPASAPPGSSEGTIYRFDPATGQTSRYLEPSGMATGLAVDRQGHLLIAQGGDAGGARAIVRRNLDSGVETVVASRYQGRRLNAPVDVAADARGRVYFTDAASAGDTAPALPNAVYRVDPDGQVAQLAADIVRPTAVEVSPDGRRLYVGAFNVAGGPSNPRGPAADRHGLRGGGVVAYDLDAEGRASGARVLLADDVLGVAGAALDADGNLYVAMHDVNRAAPRRAVVVVTPAGQLLARLPVPEAGLPAALAFGRGSDAGSLYLGTAHPWRLFRLATTRRGHHLE
jgi:gluconolactonase